jgi:5-methylcytosine-specific restriction protein A
MTIREAITGTLSGYGSAITQPLTDNPVARLLRHDLPTAIRSIISDDRYIIKGSPGQGQWAEVPWVSVFDRLITESAREGFYIVYLFRSDLSGVYLSLNQGVTRLQEAEGSNADRILVFRAEEYRVRLGILPPSLHTVKIDLRVASNSKLGPSYEAGNICAAFYAAESLPGETKLVQDLEMCLNLYRTLANKHEELPEPVEMSFGEMIEENLTKLRWHLRIDRDRRAIQVVKKAKGYTCEVCKFNFEATYGEIGKDFIEIHHLVPISELQGLMVSNHPERDYAALCSNCHSMIHHKKVLLDVAALKARLR